MKEKTKKSEENPVKEKIEEMKKKREKAEKIGKEKK
jgi:hypothetical protein